MMIRCAPAISWVPADGGVTLFDERNGSYHALNRTASVIWTALDRGQQPEAISAEMAARYGISAEEAQVEVHSFVAMALDKGLLVAE